MNRPENDPELDAWLRRSSSLHEQLARLDRSEPPEELDRIILERAREAIHTPRTEKPIRQMRWTVPVALAATLVLSFAILLRVMPDGVPSTPTAAREAPAQETAAMQQEAAGSAVQDQAVPAEAREDPASQPYAATQPPVDIVPPSPALERRAAGERELTAVTPEVRADADAWLAAIERLRAGGFEAEAERELAQFRRAYPDRSAQAAAAAATATAPER
ncbi:MAG TPA: hypothetical protein VJ011_07650 [Steroidobacteraceae bacterium]|nr:hypothetical protein [Steroidobacteraceae bacterium]